MLFDILAGFGGHDVEGIVDGHDASQAFVVV
jgi:hypothetical protein